MTLVLSGNTAEVLWIIPPRQKNCGIILHPYDLNSRPWGHASTLPLHVHVTLGTPLTTALPQLLPITIVISLASTCHSAYVAQFQTGSNTMQTLMVPTDRHSLESYCKGLPPCSLLQPHYLKMKADFRYPWLSPTCPACALCPLSSHMFLLSV